jgi:hypothetical protein
LKRKRRLTAARYSSSDFATEDETPPDEDDDDTPSNDEATPVATMPMPSKTPDAEEAKQSLFSYAKAWGGTSSSPALHISTTH